MEYLQSPLFLERLSGELPFQIQLMSNCPEHQQKISCLFQADSGCQYCGQERWTVSKIVIFFKH